MYLIDEGVGSHAAGGGAQLAARSTPRFLGQMRVRLGFGPSGEAASERRTIEVLDVFADPSLEDWQEVATELGFRSFVALPLQAGQTRARHGDLLLRVAAARSAPRRAS